MKGFSLLFLSLALIAQTAPELVVCLWPGEGIPHFLPKGPPLTIYESPSLQATVVRRMEQPVRGQELGYEETRFHTTAPGRLLALSSIPFEGRNMGDLRFLTRDDYYSGPFQRSESEIPAGDTIQFLQHRAEGSCFVRIGEDVWDADLCWSRQEKMFDRLEEATTEWWIRITEGGTPLGWLLVEEATLEIRRTF